MKVDNSALAHNMIQEINVTKETDVTDFLDRERTLEFTKKMGGGGNMFLDSKIENLVLTKITIALQFTAQILQEFFVSVDHQDAEAFGEMFPLLENLCNGSHVFSASPQKGKAWHSLDEEAERHAEYVCLAE